MIFIKKKNTIQICLSLNLLLLAFNFSCENKFDSRNDYSASDTLFKPKINYEEILEDIYLEKELEDSIKYVFGEFAKMDSNTIINVRDFNDSYFEELSKMDPKFQFVLYYYIVSKFHQLDTFYEFRIGSIFAHQNYYSNDVIKYFSIYRCYIRKGVPYQSELDIPGKIADCKNPILYEVYSHLIKNKNVVVPPIDYVLKGKSFKKFNFYKDYLKNNDLEISFLECNH